MAIETQCGQCGKRYRVKDELAGRRIKCKQCGAKIVVEDPFAAADDWGSSYDDDGYGADPFGGGGDDPYGAAAPPPRKKKKKKTGSRSASSSRSVSSGKPFWKLPVGILGMLGCLALIGLGVIGIMDGRVRAARAIVGAVFGLLFCFKLAFGAEGDE